MPSTRTAIAASLAAAALLAPAADAATPRAGDFYGRFLGAPRYANFDIDVEDDRSISVAVEWACRGKRVVTRLTLWERLRPRAGGTFSGGGMPYTATAKDHRALMDPVERRDGTAKASFQGRFESATLARGTFRATMPGCSSGELRWTARWLRKAPFHH